MTPAQAKKKYTRIVAFVDADGKTKYNTFLHVADGHALQEFAVVEDTTKKRAEWFAKMLAGALCRIVRQQIDPSRRTNPTNPRS